MAVSWPSHGVPAWDGPLHAYIQGVTPISPYDYGFVGDGTTDDTAALQAAINACPAGGGGEIVLPHSGNCYISSPLVIDRPLVLRGRGMYTQRIQSHGCDAIHISAGVSDVRIEDLELSASTRYSVTPNTYIGVKMDGTTASRINNVVIRNVFADGYHTAFQTRYVWSSTFAGVACQFGLRGIANYGLSTNNAVVNWCQLNTAAAAGSSGIVFTGQESSTDATLVTTEGWVISDLLVYNAEIAVDILGSNFIYITGGIFDYCKVHGVRVQNNSTLYANNVRIAGVYIAMDGASAATGILLNNATANANVKYARITDNEIVGYAGNSALYGIRVQGANAKAVIKGNTVMGFSTNDIKLDGAADSIVMQNACQSAVTPSIASTLPQIIENNIGTVFFSNDVNTAAYRRNTLGQKEVSGTAVPTTGSWSRGDRIVQATPAVGSPKAWRCTATGTPGTWVSEGNL